MAGRDRTRLWRERARRGQVPLQIVGLHEVATARLLIDLEFIKREQEDDRGAMAAGIERMITTVIEERDTVTPPLTRTC